jgi:hypothetical protein
MGFYGIKFHIPWKEIVIIIIIIIIIIGSTAPGGPWSS